MGGLHFQQAHNSGATWQVDALLDCIAHLAADPQDLFCMFCYQFGNAITAMESPQH